MVQVEEMGMGIRRRTTTPAPTAPGTHDSPLLLKIWLVHGSIPAFDPATTLTLAQFAAHDVKTLMLKAKAPANTVGNDFGAARIRAESWFVEIFNLAFSVKWGI